MTMQHRIFSYGHSWIIDTMVPGSANNLIFFEGGIWEQNGIGGGAWIAYVLGSRWEDQDEDVHLIDWKEFPMDIMHSFKKS